jgi:phosphinothricin acetyltransferase
MDDLHLRTATTADLTACAAIYAHHVVHGTGTWELEAPSVDELAKRFAGVAARGLPWSVATVGTRVVGYAYAGPYRLRPGWAWTVEDSIYLDPTCVGRGVGTRLLTRLCEDLTKLGLRQVVAVIGDSANAASIGVHARCGFVPCGVQRAVGHKHGRWLDCVYMQRSLGEGDVTPPAGSGWLPPADRRPAGP